jgi:hypothetical protein
MCLFVCLFVENERKKRKFTGTWDSGFVMQLDIVHKEKVLIESFLFFSFDQLQQNI